MVGNEKCSRHCVRGPQTESWLYVCISCPLVSVFSSIRWGINKVIHVKYSIIIRLSLACAKLKGTMARKAKRAAQG